MDLFGKCDRYEDEEEFGRVKAWTQRNGMNPMYLPISETSSDSVRQVIKGQECLMLGSNNYLALTKHPAVKEAVKKGVEQYGSGCTGSRLLNGSRDIHNEFEEELASFLDQEASLIFPSGYQTNIGVLSGLISEDDYVFSDAINHASIVDGIQLSPGKKLTFAHNDPGSLEKRLQKVPENAGKLIVVDGVFSMEGTISPLSEIVELARAYNARVMVDEAHSFGVLGEEGRGASEAKGVLDKIDLYMSTFSKSLATAGGFIAGPEHVIEYLRYEARAMMFSAAIPPPALMGARAAFQIIQDEPERREHLQDITAYAHECLNEIGFQTTDPAAAIVGITIGDPMKTTKLWKMLFDRGVYVNPVMAPSVPKGKSGFRTTYMATNTRSHIDEAMEIFQQAGTEMDVLS